jgi:hypothetical protein
MVLQTKKARAGPLRPGNLPGDGRQGTIGFVLHHKATFFYLNMKGAAMPFTHQPCAGFKTVSRLTGLGGATAMSLCVQLLQADFWKSPIGFDLGLAALLPLVQSHRCKLRNFAHHETSALNNNAPPEHSDSDATNSFR